MKNKTEVVKKLDELTNELETTNKEITSASLAKEWSRLENLHHHKTQIGAQIGAVMWVLSD